MPVNYERNYKTFHGNMKVHQLKLILHPLV